MSADASCDDEADLIWLQQRELSMNKTKLRFYQQGSEKHQQHLNLLQSTRHIDTALAFSSASKVHLATKDTSGTFLQSCPPFVSLGLRYWKTNVAEQHAILYPVPLDDLRLWWHSNMHRCAFYIVAQLDDHGIGDALHSQIDATDVKTPGWIEEGRASIRICEAFFLRVQCPHG